MQKIDNLLSNIKIGNQKLLKGSVTSVVVGAGAAGLRAVIELASKGVSSIVLVDNGSIPVSKRILAGDHSFFAPSQKLTVDDSIASTVRWLELYRGWTDEEGLLYSSFARDEYYKWKERGVPISLDSQTCSETPLWVKKDDKDEYVDRLFYTAGDGISSLTKLLEKEVHRLEEDSILIRLKPYIPISLFTSEEEGGHGLLLQKKNGTINDLILLSFQSAIIAIGGGLSLFERHFSSSENMLFGLMLEKGFETVNSADYSFAITSANGRLAMNGAFLSAVPDIYSCDDRGGARKNFLEDYFYSYSKMVSALIDKVIDWEFHSLNRHSMSSSLSASAMLDYAIFMETQVKGRKVYFDYSANPGWGAIKGTVQWNEKSLDEEVSRWIKLRGGFQATPLDRLNQMDTNSLTRCSKAGIDLTKAAVEVQISSIAWNGFFRAGEGNWQGLFFAGEVGSFSSGSPFLSVAFMKNQKSAVTAVSDALKFINNATSKVRKGVDKQSLLVEEKALDSLLDSIVPYTSKERFLSVRDLKKFDHIICCSMSETLSIVRDQAEIEKMLRQILFIYFECVDSAVMDFNDLELYYTVRYKALAAISAASSALFYLLEGGGSRASFLVATPDETEGFACGLGYYKLHEPCLSGEKIVCKFTGEDFSFRREKD